MTLHTDAQPYPVLIPVEEAERLVLSSVEPLPVEHVPLVDAHGRHLADEVRADHDMPAFDRSTMDGYAVRAGDVQPADREHPVLLRVIEEIAAGGVPEQRVGAGTAARIMTGAPIPEGADAVVRVEATESERSGERVSVRIYRPVEPGEAIGQRGGDVEEGELVLRRGAFLGPIELGLLATFGVARVAIYRKPRVAILSTGSELVSAEQPVEPGKLRDSNNVILAELVRRAGAAPIVLGIAPDRLEALAERMEEALEGADIVVTSGGVSVGDYDYVGRAYERLGVRVIFWKTLMRPGKPILYGQRAGKSLFGLAGNPASSFANAQLFLLPAVRRMAGSIRPLADRAQALCDTAIEAGDSDRTAFLRGTTYVSSEGELRVRVAQKQSSGVLSSFLGTNCFAKVPGRQGFRPGEPIEVQFTT